MPRGGTTTDDRGQTTQDFAVGVSIFVLVVAFALTFLPTTVTPFDDRANAPSSAQADRVATGVLGDLSYDGTSNGLDTEATVEFFDDEDADSIRAAYDLPTTTSVNVSLQNLDGTRVENDTIGDLYRPIAVGDPIRPRSVATATRIVALGSDRYRLVVRVW
ncbi:hypothetical protein ACFQE1_07715 [Halobium palmae]|uniref:Flagellin n=1 Tax=Halobium palmae TaxID=1776492 RepID=A0ABD5RYB8_9EURY